MPKCEKCGYKRATLKKCMKCGRRNPCPVKRTLFYAAMVLGPIAVIVGGAASAQWVAKKRVEAATAEVTSFAAPREPKQPGKGRGLGRGNSLSWR